MTKIKPITRIDGTRPGDGLSKEDREQVEEQEKQYAEAANEWLAHEFARRGEGAAEDFFSGRSGFTRGVSKTLSDDLATSAMIEEEYDAPLECSIRSDRVLPECENPYGNRIKNLKEQAERTEHLSSTDPFIVGARESLKKLISNTPALNNPRKNLNADVLPGAKAYKDSRNKTK